MAWQGTGQYQIRETSFDFGRWHGCERYDQRQEGDDDSEIEEAEANNASKRQDAG